MNPILKNVLAVFAGVIVGSMVNMGLVTIGDLVVPGPEGFDRTDIEGLKNSMHLLQPQHFIFPFLAHALGTLVGALVVVKVAASRHMALALGIGVWFLIGGITVVMMMPNTPLWFKIVDLGLAYLPMAFLGGKLGLGKK